MEEAAVSKRFSQKFGAQISFARTLYAGLKGEKNFDFNLALANYLHSHQADDQLVLSALLAGLSKKELEEIKKKGVAKHVLEQHEKEWGLDRKAVKDFSENLKEALEIIASYIQLKANPEMDANAHFAAALEAPKLRASLLRAAVLNFELEKPSKQSALHVEVAEHVYIPWLNLLGLVDMSNELGEKVLKIKDPLAYEKLFQHLETMPVSKRPFGKMIASLKKKISRLGLEIEDVQFRRKSIYSIYQKLKAYGCPVGNPAYDHDPRLLDDLYGLRVVLKADETESESEQVAKARRVLDVVRSSFEMPKEARIDEYVAEKAKPSGYKAIHTPVIGPQNLPIEIQTVTKPWHAANEAGLSSHFFYKLSKAVSSPLRQVLVRIQEELKRGVPIERVFRSIGKPLIYVTTDRFGPQDHALPAGSTPLDLWYAHGFRKKYEEKMKGKIFFETVMVNGETVPLTTILKPGDHVRFDVSGSPPKVELIDRFANEVATPEAREGLWKLRRKLGKWRWLRRKEES
ncbi:MAG: hypothetical protein QXR53_01575 [Candidatus Norongarragalinales archaeon]